MTQREMEEFLLAEGAAFAGGCALGCAPVQGQPDLTYAFSFGVKLTDSILKTVQDGPSFAYFHHYRTANALLDSLAFRLCGLLEANGYQAFPVAASQSQGKENPYRGVFAHKTAAVLSGLGFVGKSGLFLSNDHGSKVRLATVLTDMPLTATFPLVENGCGNCNACVRACPAGAIYGQLPTMDGERNFDAEKCSRYMKTHFQEIGRGSVCGVCIRVCPKNKL